MYTFRQHSSPLLETSTEADSPPEPSTVYVVHSIDMYTSMYIFNSYTTHTIMGVIYRQTKDKTRLLP